MSRQKNQIRAEFRAAVFSRDNHRCAVCGEAGSLDAHHIEDRNEMPNGGYVAENGISLCPDCHRLAEIFHASGGALYKKGFLPADLYRIIGSNLDEAKRAAQ